MTLTSYNLIYFTINEPICSPVTMEVASAEAIALLIFWKSSWPAPSNHGHSQREVAVDDGQRRAGSGQLP